MKPLSRKIRSRVLWVLLALFVVLTPILIGYSQGYRLDDALGLIQTGGIYLHSDVANTSVFIDDEFLENNGAFLKNTLIQDLLPNRYYALRVERDGYQSWVKVLLVKPNLVTEARVLMLPTEFTWRQIWASTTLELTDTEVATTSDEDATTTQEVLNPEYVELAEYFAEDKEQFEVEVATTTYEYIRGVRTATTTTILETKFPQWLNEFASTSRLSEKEMVREREGMVTWIENGDIYAGWGRVNDPVPYFFCMESCADRLSINWHEPILRYEFYPNRNDLLLVLSERGLYVVELDNKQFVKREILISDLRMMARWWCLTAKAILRRVGK
ncbi:MAG: hypothetical protein UU98_C0010G0026 [Parcubacteria group bacterium GW2011_GWD2_42_14]|nr:MAG: hypothetical protein UU98_C0010G0026 [Parcubacteria group bacterium GW2011_GWD2_42_14]